MGDLGAWPATAGALITSGRREIDLGDYACPNRRRHPIAAHRLTRLTFPVLPLARPRTLRPACEETFLRVHATN